MNFFKNITLGVFTKECVGVVAFIGKSTTMTLNFNAYSGITKGITITYVPTKKKNSAA